MKIIGIKQILLTVFIIITLTNCSTSKEGKNPSTVAEAEAELAKKEKIKQKEAAKSQKEAKKNYWKRQSKATKKSVKRNERRQKKYTRKKGKH